MNTDVLPTSDPPMIIFKVQKSRWFLLGPMAALGIAALLMIGLLLVMNPAQSLNILIQLGVFIVGVIGFSIAALIIWVDWSNTYYVLTSETVEKTSGFLTLNRTYMSLHDLSKIECRTGILGSIFHFGTIVIESETSETPLFLHGVTDAIKVADLIRQTRAHVANTDK